MGTRSLQRSRRMLSFRCAQNKAQTSAPLHYDRSKWTPFGARQLFENTEWAAALAKDEELRAHVRSEGASRKGPVAVLRDALEARWEGMSDSERRECDAAFKEHAVARAAEDAARFDGGASDVSLLNALLLRSPGVRMLSLCDVPWHDREWRETPELRADNVLRRVGAAWTELRVVHLGKAAVAAADIHALLAACQKLAQLHLENAELSDRAALFGAGMAQHSALRYVGLPSLTIFTELGPVVRRLMRRCPQLYQIALNSGTCRGEDESWAVQDLARAAARRGLRCFTSWRCVVHGQLHGADEVYDDGHYSGDGNVITYLLPLDDEDEDEYDDYTSTSGDDSPDSPDGDDLPDSDDEDEA